MTSNQTLNQEGLLCSADDAVELNMPICHKKPQSFKPRGEFASYSDTFNKVEQIVVYIKYIYISMSR